MLLIIGISVSLYKKLRKRTKVFIQNKEINKTSNIKNSIIFGDFDVILAFIIIFHVESNVCVKNG